MIDDQAFTAPLRDQTIGRREGGDPRQGNNERVAVMGRLVVSTLLTRYKRQYAFKPRYGAM